MLSLRPLRLLPWLILAGCAEDSTRPVAGPDLDETGTATLADEVRALTAGRGIGPLERPAPIRAELVRLGQALAFDKILSGNRDIACMTCHLPGFATGDGRSLSIGQGAAGLGTARVHPPDDFIPRNAPPLFNLFAHKTLFWDGRVTDRRPGQLRTPGGPADQPRHAERFEFGALSALPLFPVLSREEMRSRPGNELGDIKDKDPQQIWNALMVRLGAIPRVPADVRGGLPGDQVRPDDLRAREQRDRRISHRQVRRSTTRPGTASSPATTTR